MKLIKENTVRILAKAVVEGMTKVIKMIMSRNTTQMITMRTLRMMT